MTLQDGGKTALECLQKAGAWPPEAPPGHFQLQVMTWQKELKHMSSDAMQARLQEHRFPIAP
jgi:hypothetical protein